MKNLFLLILLSTIVVSCSKNSEPSSVLQALPVVTTNAVTDGPGTTAISGGIVTDDGGSAITSRGVCWGLTTNPDLSGSHSTEGTGTGSFSSTITGLVPGTIYYVRAYAMNTTGIGYGNEILYTASQPASTAGVYVAGVENTPTGNYARVWKNGVLTNLTDGGEAGSVFVTDTDVYVVGWKEVATTSKATIWKNGVPTFLEDGYAESVFVAGNDVYVGGAAWVGGYYVPKIWKNGLAINLPFSSAYGGAVHSVYVSGTDVYAAGEENGSNGIIAKLWKNGTIIHLSNDQSTGKSVMLHGTNVYVAGSQLNSAIYWMNGVPFSGSIQSKYSFVYSNGNDLYIGGSVSGTACYLKNTIPTYLTNGQYNAWAQSMSIASNGDVYVAGNQSTGANQMATVWKNGIATSLTDGVNYAVAHCVFVKD